MICYSCKIFEPLQQVSYGYGRQVFSVIAPGAFLLFTAFMGVWFVWMLIERGCFKGELTFENFAKPLLTFSVVALFLRQHELYWQWFYTPVMKTTSSLAQTIMGVGTFEKMPPTIVGMLTTMDTQLMKVFNIVSLVVTDASFYQIGLVLGALILVIPFVFVWGIFLAYLLEGIFKLLAITAISPILIAAAAFPATRGFMSMGVRIVLDGCLTVIFAAVAMGFTLSVANITISKITDDGLSMKISADEFIFSGEYWMLFILGFISVLFHLKAATIASNMSGAQDGPGAAAMVVSTGMAAAGTALRFTKTRLGIVGRNVMSEGGGRLSGSSSHSSYYNQGVMQGLTTDVFQGTESGSSQSSSSGTSCTSNKGGTNAFGI